MSVRDAGRKGGRATRARYGPEFFAQIGQKGGKAVAKPFAVDVASGVEAEPGVKDEAKVRSFFEAVHAAAVHA